MQSQLNKFDLISISIHLRHSTSTCISQFIWNHLLNVQLARRLQEIDIFYFVESDNSQQQQKTKFIIFAFS